MHPASLACIWEATARKAGNVHRFADFDNLTYLDFLLSAIAISPAMISAPRQSLGETILQAIRATREVVSTNTNLGMVLLLAPLAKVGSKNPSPKRRGGSAQNPSPVPSPERRGGSAQNPSPVPSPKVGGGPSLESFLTPDTRFSSEQPHQIAPPLTLGEGTGEGFCADPSLRFGEGTGEGFFLHNLESILDATAVADTQFMYEAIRIAVPGGMGKVESQDIAEEPTLPLREVMRLAADRDMIARQYVDGFRSIFEEGVPVLWESYESFGCVEAAILGCQLHWLAHFPDSLILRKRGATEAETVRSRAAHVEKLGLATPQGKNAYREFDAWLREDTRGRNPGTTADLVTACLFIAMATDRMDSASPFPWTDY